jgi:O-antigen/teichoic acid export membrane protein
MILISNRWRWVRDIGGSSQLLIANFVSQTLTALSLLVLARIYAPADFGVFGTFLAIVQTVGLVSTLRFDIAIPVPKARATSFGLLFNGMTTVALVTLAVVLIFLSIYISGFSTEILPVTLATPIVVGGTTMLVGLQQLLIQMNLREKTLTRVALAVMTQSTLSIAIQFSCVSIFEGQGLQIGYMIGLLASSAILLANLPFRYIGSISNIRRQSAIFQRYLGFAFKASLASVLSSLSNYAPVLFFGALYSRTDAGIFLIAFRLISMPVDLIGKAVNQVIISNISHEIRYGGNHLLMLGYMNSGIWKISIIPIGAICLFSPTIIPFFFDKSWNNLGIYVSLLALGSALQFAASTLIHVMFLSRQEGRVIELQGILLAARLSGLGFGLFWASPLPAVLLFSAGSACGYIVMLSSIFRSCGGSRSDWITSAGKELGFALLPLSVCYVLLYVLNAHGDAFQTLVCVLLSTATLVIPWVWRLRGVPNLLEGRALGSKKTLLVGVSE